MDFMELMRDTTRFLREAQYLTERNHMTVFLSALSKNIHTNYKLLQPRPNLAEMLFLLSHLLGDLKDSQKSQRPQYADPKRHARPEEAPHHLKDAANDDLP